MVVSAVRGALAFLTRLPVESTEGDWEAFRAAPVALPLAGYAVGALLGLPVALAVALGLPAPTVALAYLAAVYLLTGVHHADGVADLADAAAVHGDPAERRAVMTDTTVGVGAALAVALVVTGLALGGLALPVRGALSAFALVVAVEVGAKLGMATVACLGTASHQGTGAAFTSRADRDQLAGPVVVALPATLLVLPTLAGAGAVLAGFLTALGVVRWADARLGGVGGDAFGATNELARVLALHAGVATWALL